MEQPTCKWNITTDYDRRPIELWETECGDKWPLEVADFSHFPLIDLMIFCPWCGREIEEDE